MRDEHPAYAVDQFRDPAAEIKRLAQQAEILAATEEEALRTLGLPDRGRVLDMGCGPGFVAARIRKTRPELEVIGLDRDAAVLRQASGVIEVFEGSAERMPFPDGHFDCVYARLVLRHLEHPDAALAEMYRVLRPKGRAIVIDSDDGALLLCPRPESFVRALEARQKTFQRRGVDPFIGRRLRALFHVAGFVDPAMRPLVVDSVSVGLGPFARIVLSPVMDAIDADLLDGGGVAAAIADVQSWVDDPSSFGLMTVIAHAGSKR